MTTVDTQSQSNPSTSPRWTVDASHSSVAFSVRHMMITNVRGNFETFEATATLDPAKPENASVEAKIDVASVKTGDDKRDEHLRSADFFDVEHHPSISFRSRGVARTSDGLAVTGDLTIRGTTKEVTLAVEDITGEQTDPWGNTRIGASASTKIRRSDFGITWNSALEAGGVLVGDEIKIQLEVSLIKQ